MESSVTRIADPHEKWVERERGHERGHELNVIVSSSYGRVRRDGLELEGSECVTLQSVCKQDNVV